MGAIAAIQPTGRLDVRLRRRNGYLETRVVDDGPGVPENERQRIFERFVRLDPSKPGHGLDLAIARRIAQQHGGELTCGPTPDGVPRSGYAFPPSVCWDAWRPRDPLSSQAHGYG